MSFSVEQRQENAVSSLHRVDTFPFVSALYNSYSEQQVFNSATGANVLLALHRACEARELAISWRDFRVGAALMSFCYEPPVMQIVSGINIKPYEDSGSVNIHAEQLALKKIQEYGRNIITLIAVVGDLQADTQSGSIADTLHPCGLCRDALDASGLVDDERTLVVSALPDLQTLEFYSFGALKKFHEGGQNEGIYTVRLPELELLTPFEPISNEPLKLIDTPEIQAEEDIWEENVELPLLQFRLTGAWPTSS